MNRIFLLVIALLVSVPSFGQELSKREKRQLEKELRKEQAAEEATKKAEMIQLMIENRQLVLEADQLRDRRGTTINVPSMINFIAVDSTEGVIQIGSNGYVGMNGVGGITVEGTVDNYSFTHDEKRGTYTVSYTLRSPSGTYDVNMSILGNGRADATVSSNWPGRLNYMGNLVHPAASRVFKGTTRY